MRLLLTLVFVLSGAAGLMYESIWSRYLGLLVGHSAYAQVIVLVIFGPAEYTHRVDHNEGRPHGAAAG